MNTPEHLLKDNSINENVQQYIDKIEAQIAQTRIERIHRRDYGRILRDYNTPAQWYKPGPVPCSIYFYDPQYQKYIQQQLKPSANMRPVRPPIQIVNQTTPRKNYPVNFHSSSNNHQARQINSSRLQSIPTLPPIATTKNSTAE